MAYFLGDWEEEEHSELEEKKEPKQSIFIRLKIWLITCLTNYKDQFMFSPTNYVFSYVINKNKNILTEEIKQNVTNPGTQNLKFIDQVTDYIEKFYSSLRVIVQENEGLEVNQALSLLREKGFECSYDPLVRNTIPLSKDSIDSKFISARSPYSQKDGIKRSNFNFVEKEPVIDEQSYTDSTFWDVVQLALEVWLSYWEYFCYFMLIMYQIYSQGYIMALIPFAIFGYALIEETRSVFRFWTIAFSFITAVIILKFANVCFFIGWINHPKVRLVLSIFVKGNSSKYGCRY